jgi:hypothetical protein
MGQYFLIVNLDKREFIHPCHFGDGLKFAEFSRNADGTMFALALLLSEGFRERGDDPIIGSWAGDRIVIAGDAAAKDGAGSRAGRNLYTVVRETLDCAARKHNEPGLYRDVSNEILRAMEHLVPDCVQKGVQACT